METHLNLKICRSSCLDIASHQLLFGTRAVSIYRLASGISGQERNLTVCLSNLKWNALQSGTHPKLNNNVGNNVDDFYWMKKMDV